MLQPIYKHTQSRSKQAATPTSSMQEKVGKQTRHKVANTIEKLQEQAPYPLSLLMGCIDSKYIQ